MIYGTLLVVSLLPSFVIGKSGHQRMGIRHHIHRPLEAQKPVAAPTQGPDSVPVFNPRFAQREQKKVTAKYEDASEVLQGLGLSPPLNIPLVNNFSPFEDPNAVFAFPSTLGNESTQIIAPASVPLSQLCLTDFMSGGLDIMYYGPVEIGTPGQLMPVDIDTGSADLWIASNCSECAVKQFDSTLSTTFEPKGEDFSIAYGAGEVLGSLGEDVVTIAGLTYHNQTFGLADMESHDFDGYPNSGILGLAFGSIATSGEPTLFEHLMESGQIILPFFSVHLARGQANGSEVCFGCYDVGKTKGSLSWVHVVSKTYWTVHMDGLRANASSVKTDVIAAIDTGTTLIYVPDHVAQAFYKLIPGAKQVDQFGPGFFTYPCSSKLEIAFKFGGFDFPINQRDFNMGRVAAKSSDCVGGILSLGEGFPDNIAIIGDEFLKSWYTVYDYSNGARVGFAPSINDV